MGNRSKAARWVFARLLKTPEKIRTVDIRLRGHDGEWRHVEGIATIRLADPVVAGIVANARDVTARVQLAAELRAAVATADAANLAKGEFLAMMSHELLTPLQAVLGFAEFLLADPHNPLTDDQRLDVTYIHQGGQRILMMINQLLDLTRMEMGNSTSSKTWWTSLP